MGVLYPRMSEILEIVLLNAPNYAIDPVLLCKTACLNRNYREITKRAWDFVDASQYKPFVYGVYKCRFCNAKPADLKVFGCCRKCSHEFMKVISATDAKKRYCMTDEDLVRIPCHTTMHRTYRKMIKLFDENEVALYALYKYKPRPIIKTRNSMREPRIRKLEETLDVVLESIDREKYEFCIDGFVRNGRGGMRQVKHMLLLWDAFEMLLHTEVVRSYLQYINAFEISCIREDFIYGYVTSDEVIARLSFIGMQRAVAPSYAASAFSDGV